MSFKRSGFTSIPGFNASAGQYRRNTMTFLQKRRAKGLQGAGQFAGVEHREPELRLGTEQAPRQFRESQRPIEGGVAHAHCRVNATAAYAKSEEFTENTREVFAVQSVICKKYAADLEKLQDAGKTGPENFQGLADNYDARAEKADKARAWTSRTRRANATRSGEYRYLARTLRKLAAGEIPTDRS